MQSSNSIRELQSSIYVRYTSAPMRYTDAVICSYILIGVLGYFDTLRRIGIIMLRQSAYKSPACELIC